MADPVYRCARCAVEYVSDPPPSCGRCTAPLYRLPDAWAGRALDHAPREPRVLTAYDVRSRRAARRPAGDVLAPIFGASVPQGWLLVVTGLPGSGKSTWTLRALESGWAESPMLVAAEEGVQGAGLADRVARLEVTRTKFCDAASFPEVTSILDEHEPDVLAIDSVTALNLEPQDLLALRRSYPRVAFVAVVQSTKSGAHRGSQAWIHDADAVLRLEPGSRWELVKSWFSPLASGVMEEVT